MSTIAIVLTIVLFSLSWIGATLIFHKYSDQLKGKVWVIGLLGIIGFIALFWLIAIYSTVDVLAPIATTTLPWWIIYMYYLNKAKIIKERKLTF